MDNMVIANIALDCFCIILSLISLVYLANSCRFHQKLYMSSMGIRISNMFMIIGDLTD